MKNKLLFGILICIIVIISIIGVLIYLKISEENNYDIIFNDIKYTSINNIIFYNSKLNLDEETKKNLDLISREFLTKYPNKQILYLRKMGKINGQDIYRFIQIYNNIIIDDAELNIYFNKASGIDYIIGVSNNNGGMNRVNWKNISDTVIKIDKDNIKKIAQKHIFREYEISNDLRCETELRYYKSKICWKITFYNSLCENEIFIDANSGKIVDTISHKTLFID